MKQIVIVALILATRCAVAQSFMDSIQCMTLFVPMLHTIDGPPFHPIITDSIGNKYEYKILPGRPERSWYRCTRLILYSRLTGCSSPIYKDESARYYISPLDWERP